MLDLVDWATRSTVTFSWGIIGDVYSVHFILAVILVNIPLYLLVYSTVDMYQPYLTDPGLHRSLETCPETPLYRNIRV